MGVVTSSSLPCSATVASHDEGRPSMVHNIRRGGGPPGGRTYIRRDGGIHTRHRPTTDVCVPARPGQEGHPPRPAPDRGRTAASPHGAAPLDYHPDQPIAAYPKRIAEFDVDLANHAARVGHSCRVADTSE